MITKSKLFSIVKVKTFQIEVLTLWLNWICQNSKKTRSLLLVEFETSHDTKARGTLLHKYCLSLMTIITQKTQTVVRKYYESLLSSTKISSERASWKCGKNVSCSRQTECYYEYQAIFGPHVDGELAYSRDCSINRFDHWQLHQCAVTSKLFSWL